MTLLSKLKLGHVETTNLAPGINVKTLKHKNIVFTSWSLKGSDQRYEIFDEYFESTKGIIFVVDVNLFGANNFKRILRAKEELHGLLQEDMLLGIPLLVVANKTDLPDAMTVDKVKEAMSLGLIKDRRWKIQGTSAKQGDGVFEGLGWLSKEVEDG